MHSSGNLDKDEFSYLHKMIVEGEAKHAHLLSNANQEVAFERKASKTLRKGSKILGLMLGMLLLISILSNLITVYMVVDSQVAQSRLSVW